MDERLEKEQKQEGDKPPASKSTSSAPSTPTTATASTPSSETSGLSFSSIKARFQKIRKSARDRKKFGADRPSWLKEVYCQAFRFVLCSCVLLLCGVYNSFVTLLVQPLFKEVFACDTSL